MKPIKFSNRLHVIMIIAGCLLLNFCCDPDEAKIPEVTTVKPTDITVSTAATGGNLVSDGGADITEHGICIATTPQPVWNRIKVSGAPKSGAFSVNPADLEPNTTYYVRAYATNRAGTGYGRDEMFTTKKPGDPGDGEASPEITTGQISDITTTTAKAEGTVVKRGTPPLTEYGFCYSVSVNPTVGGDKLIVSEAVSADNTPFSGQLINLTPYTRYYVRAYAKNDKGTVYGTQTEFTTESVAPVVATVAGEALTGTSTTVGGNISETGAPHYFERGVCYSLQDAPAIDGGATRVVVPHNENAGQGAFSAQLTGLTPGTVYYARAYAKYKTDKEYTVYGETTSFRTKNNNARLHIVSIDPLPIEPITLPYVPGTDEYCFTFTFPAPPAGVRFECNFSGDYEDPNASSVWLKGGGTNNNIPLGATTSVLKVTAEDGVTSLTYTFTYIVGEIVKDVDNNTYGIYEIGGKKWMNQNLKTTRYNDGAAIPKITDAAQWSQAAGGAYCWYNNVDAVYTGDAAYCRPANETTYQEEKNTLGALYNYETVKTNKLCPAGWHIPSTAEWDALIASLGGEYAAGQKMRDSFGFNALPGGWRNNDGSFESAGTTGYGYWWTSASTDAIAYALALRFSNNQFVQGGGSYKEGASVRCVKD